MAKYRITSTAAFNDTFRLLSEQRDPNDNGVMIDVPVRLDKQERFCCLVEAGSIVEVADSIVPGPMFEPLDAAATAACEKHPDAWHPEFYNTLDALPKSLTTDAQASARDAAEVKENVAELTKAVTALLQSQTPTRETPHLSLKARS